MINYVQLDSVSLDWGQIDQDLIKYHDDNVFLDSIVNHDTEFSRSWSDNLTQLTNQYQRYGYTEHNTKIWKSTNRPDAIKFAWADNLVRQLPVDCAIVTLTRQDPGQILPWHKDRHFMLRRIYPDDKRMAVRFLVFMENWKHGHVLQIHRDMLYNWNRGQVVVWHPDTYHIAANIGIETKWTCNITGFVTDDKLAELLQQMTPREYDTMDMEN